MFESQRADDSRRLSAGCFSDSAQAGTLGEVYMLRCTALAVCGILALLAGCGQGVQHAELGRQFVLTEEPSAILGIVDYHEAETKPTDVSLIGRIGFKNLKWSSQSAMFLLVDPAEALEGADHVCHDENCPFCKGKKGASQSRAIVMLVGE